MSRHIWSSCLGMACILALAGIALAQNTPPVIWMIPAHSHSIESIAFSADGQTIVSGAGDEAKTWRAADGAFIQVYPDHGDGVISVDIAPSGEHLAVGYIVSGYPPGGVMDLWHVPTKAVQATHGGCHVTFSPLGDVIASGGGGVNRYARLHRVADGVEIGDYYNGSGYITDVAYSPDGDLLAVANTDNTVKLWDIDSGTILHTLTGHTDDVRCLAFSPDGQLLASGAGGWDLPSDSTIKLWRVADGELLQTLTGHGEWTHCLAFHPNGMLLTSSGRDSGTPYSASLRFWRIPDGELHQEYNGLALDIAYSPDGESYCYGTTDGSLVLAGGTLAGVADDGQPTSTPTTARLWQNYPNPFNPSTAIRFELPASGLVSLHVYAVDGRRISSLVDELMPAGHHEVIWNGRDDRGNAAASGIYIYRLDAGARSETKRMVLLK